MSADIWKTSVLESSLDKVCHELDKVESVSEFIGKLRELNPHSPRRLSYRRLERQARLIANRFASMAEKEEETV